MAGIVPKLLFLGNTQSGPAYVAPSTSGSYAIVKSINVCNTTTTSQSFSINLIPTGGAPAINNAVLGSVPLSANNVFSYETSIVVPEGYSIYISQPENGLTFAISGVEYVV